MFTRKLVKKWTSFDGESSELQVYREYYLYRFLVWRKYLGTFGVR